MIKIDFVRSEDNTSDILTKNVTVDLFAKHIKHLIIDKGQVEPKGNKSLVRKGVGRVTASLSPSPIPMGPKADEDLIEGRKQEFEHPDLGEQEQREKSESSL